MLKGSEKQVKWAEDLLETVIRIAEESKEEAVKMNNKGFADSMDKLIANVKAETYAGNIIDTFRNIEYVNDSKMDIKQIRTQNFLKLQAALRFATKKYL